MVLVCLSVCDHHNLSTTAPVFFAFGIWLKDPGEKLIENVLGPMTIVDRGGGFFMFYHLLTRSCYFGVEGMFQTAQS